jgi:hypothetical protein
VIGLPADHKNGQIDEANDSAINEPLLDLAEPKCPKGQETVQLIEEPKCLSKCAEGYHGIGNHCFEIGCPMGMADKVSYCEKHPSYTRPVEVNEA